MKVIPLNDKVLLERVEAEEKTSGGILLPNVPPAPSLRTSTSTNALLPYEVDCSWSTLVALVACTPVPSLTRSTGCSPIASFQ